MGDPTRALSLDHCVLRHSFALLEEKERFAYLPVPTVKRGNRKFALTKEKNNVYHLL